MKNTLNGSFINLQLPAEGFIVLLGFFFDMTEEFQLPDKVKSQIIPSPVRNGGHIDSGGLQSTP